MHIKYDMDLQAQVVKFALNDWRFAPAGTYTPYYDWRYNLEKGNLIDCMDNEKDWFKSTVLDSRVTENQDGDQIKEIYVGFRYYH